MSSLLLDLQDLTVKSANEGAISESELRANQLQIDSILESIDRIANTTQFAGEKLVNGNFAYTTSGINTSDVVTATVYGARLNDNGVRAVQIEVTASAQHASVATLTGSTLANNSTIEITGPKGLESFSFSTGTTIANIATAINDSLSVTGVSAYVSGSALRLDTQAFGSNATVSVRAIDGAFLGVTQGQTADGEGVDATVLINGTEASVDGKRPVFAAMASTDRRSHRQPRYDHRYHEHLLRHGAVPSSRSDGRHNRRTRRSRHPVDLLVDLGNADVGYLSTLKSGGAASIIGRNFSDAKSIVDEAINQVATIRGRIGGLQKNQIETNVNSQRVALENARRRSPSFATPITP